MCLGRLGAMLEVTRSGVLRLAEGLRVSHLASEVQEVGSQASSLRRKQSRNWMDFQALVRLHPARAPQEKRRILALGPATRWMHWGVPCRIQELSTLLGSLVLSAQEM